MFLFTGPDRNARLPGQHERTGRTGGQTGGPGQTDSPSRTVGVVGQTDGSGGRPADGGLGQKYYWYSLPA